MRQYLEFPSSQWNRSPRTTFSRRTLGASPVAVRNPGPEKSYEAPDNFPAPGLLHVSPVVNRGVGFSRRPFCFTRGKNHSVRIATTLLSQSWLWFEPVSSLFPPGAYWSGI